MLAATMTYEFILENGERTKGASLWTTTGPEREQPAYPGSNIECDLESVDSIILSDGRIIKVFWAREIFGQTGEPLLLREGPRDLALILTFEGEVLIARSEPTLDDRIGLSVHSEQGRVRLTGIGDLVEIKEPSRTYQLVGDLESVYSWRKLSPSSCAHTNSSIRKDNKGGVQGAPTQPSQPSQPAGGQPDGGATPDGGPRPPSPQ